MSDKKQPMMHPWATLYDVESGIKPLARATREGAGRPVKAIPRMKTSISLTDEEKRLFEKLAYLLGERLHPNRVTKSQVMGLALRLLDGQVDALPAGLRTWEDVARILFAESYPQPDSIPK